MKTWISLLGAIVLTAWCATAEAQAKAGKCWTQLSALANTEQEALHVSYSTSCTLRNAPRLYLNGRLSALRPFGSEDSAGQVVWIFNVEGFRPRTHDQINVDDGPSPDEHDLTCFLGCNRNWCTEIGQCDSYFCTAMSQQFERPIRR